MMSYTNENVGHAFICTAVEILKIDPIGLEIEFYSSSFFCVFNKLCPRAAGPDLQNTSTYFVRTGSGIIRT